MMADASTVHDRLPGLAALWDRMCETWLLPRARCGIGVVVNHSETGSCGFLSLSSELEAVLRRRPQWYDLRSGFPVPISEPDAMAQLIDGAVCAMVTRRGLSDSTPTVEGEVLARLDQVRLERVAARNLLLEIGLQTMQSHGGPPPVLLDAIADYWNADLAISLDVATELAQGASRQRFVDRAYTGRARLRLESVERVLTARQVRSNPLLVI